MIIYNHNYVIHENIMDPWLWIMEKTMKHHIEWFIDHYKHGFWYGVQKDMKHRGVAKNVPNIYIYIYIDW